MSWTTRVIEGGKQKVLQPRLFLYGVPGVGKSSFGAKLPKPVMIDFDKGIDYVSADRIHGPKTWMDSLSLIREIAAKPEGYKSLVIDTVDPLEELVVEHVLHVGKRDSLSKFDFGAGYEAVANEWKLLLAELDVARQNGMLVCLVGHAQVRQAQDPQFGQFDQFVGVLGKRCWMLTCRWADLVGFAAFDAALLSNKDEPNRMVVTGERLLFTMRGSGYEAKNRWSLPTKMPLSWKELEAAITRHRQTASEVRAKIEKLAAGTPYAEKAKTYVSEAGDDLNALLAIEENLVKKLAEPAPPATTGDQVPVAPAQTAPSVASSTPPAPPAPVAAAPLTPATPAPSEPPPVPQDTIAEVTRRILQMAEGTRFADAASGYVSKAVADLGYLLKTEAALKSAIEKEKNGATVQA